MRRREFMRSVTAVGGIALSGETVLAADTQLEPGTWYDATVTDVTDGDTVDVALDSDGTEYEIRVLGLDTPETKRNGQYESVPEWEGIEDDRYLADWGEAAKDYAQQEFPDGTSVQVAVDENEDEVDAYGRLLAYIRYDKTGDGSMDTLYNRDLVAQGYARVYGSSLSRHDEFWQAEHDARAAGAGVWAQSDPENTTSVDNDPVSSVFVPNASSVRTDAGAIDPSRVPVFAESTAYQNTESGAVSYTDIPLVGLDEANNLALVGGLSINEAHESDQEGQHEVFLTNLLDYLAGTSGQVLVDGGHGQFNATYSLSNEDAVYYQRYLEGQGLPFEQVNTLDGTGDNALSTARAIFVTNPTSAFTTSEVDALSAFVDDGGAVVLMGSALASASARSNLNQLAADLGSDLRLNEDQVLDDSNNVGDSALVTTSNFDAGFPLFDAYSGASGDTDPAVTTGSATNVTDTAATLDGSLDDLGGASSADCYFEYRETGSTSWTATSAQTLSSTGSFSEDVSGLSAGTDYEFRAAADASDGDTTNGATATFATSGGSSGDSAPTIDQFVLGDRSNGGWARVDVDWAVSDADGDLASVALELRQDGLVDSVTDSVSGASASGSTWLEEKNGAGTYDVVVTVTDAAGNATSQTKQISL